MGAARADLKTTAAAFKELESKAPSEIKADMKTLSDALNQVASTPSGALALAGDKKFSDASDRITAWGKKNCGFDLSAS